MITKKAGEDMLNNEQFEEKTISRKEIYSGKIIDVAVDEVRLPDGGTSKRELVFHPEMTAARELEEETGYRAKSLSHLTSMYLSPGFANEVLHIYHAQGVEKVENPLAQDEDEVLELYHLTLEEAQQAMKDQLICDAKTIYAIQYWELLTKGK